MSSLPSKPIFASQAARRHGTSSFGRFCICRGASVMFFGTE